jgi:hypothetical protein
MAVFVSPHYGVPRTNVPEAYRNDEKQGKMTRYYEQLEVVAGLRLLGLYAPERGTMEWTQLLRTL